DPAAGVRPLTVLDGEGEEVLALGGALRSHARGQHHRLAVAHDHRAIGLLGHLPGLELERVAVDVNVDGMSHTGFCPRVSAGVRRTPCGASVPAPGPPESCRPRTNQLLIVGSAHRRIPSFSMIAGTARCPSCAGTRSDSAACRSASADRVANGGPWCAA